MSKKSYIFCFAIFAVLFITAYLIGVVVARDSESQVNITTDTDIFEESSEVYEGYWIKAVNGYIVIYNHEMELISNTEISVDLFSLSERNILESGIYVETAEELFSYLESYTS